MSKLGKILWGIAGGLDWMVRYRKPIAMLAAVILVYVFVARVSQNFNDNVAWHNQHLPGHYDCGVVNGVQARCIDYKGNLWSVRDYEVECDTWYGARATCPREDLQILVNSTPPTPLNQTLNCHYFQEGSYIKVTEEFDYNPFDNSTATKWGIVGGPC